jgi:hypothetical protein
MEYIGYVAVGTTSSSQATRIKKSVRITSVPDGIAECSSVSEIRTYSYLELAALIPVDINFHNLSLPHLFQYYQLWPPGI